ncbi:MAG: gluconokinase [Rhizobiales bacterium]|nr:gluconokinase [Hyphomicrobiales bacterium]MBI3671896.1 gluconokinase [Hyphomicrobiales bacterium]
MGVTSCGKTTVGEALAHRLGVAFVEGDRLHPAENIAKMSAGIALNDDDRWPWLAKIGEALKGTTGIIASCSALKRSYREAIATAAGRPVRFVFLQGDRELLATRIAARRNHFMPPALLDSQLATLEPPAPDERAVAIDIALAPDAIVERAADFLLAHGN